MIASTPTAKPVALIVLDGFGYSEDPEHNAILAANTPHWDRLWRTCPHRLLSGSGLDVGLPAGQMGNSEVGHLNIGAGRVVYQDLTRISKAIQDGDFVRNPTLSASMDAAISSGHAVHIIGLLSPGGVHSHEDHLAAVIEMAAARGAKQIYLHALLDGRDTPPRSAMASLQRFEALFASLPCGRIASISGRYYAMDRDQRWERIEAAYDVIVMGRAPHRADSSVNALVAAYQRGENDEFVVPTLIAASAAQTITLCDGDAVIIMNYRADRARQFTRALANADFTAFKRPRWPRLHLVTLTQYATDIDAPAAFAPAHLENVLGEYLARQNKRQLRIAETEKYAHVTFFFNGGVEQPFAGEDRVLIPSPQVATYDLQPEMNAQWLTDKLVAAITAQTYDVIICNYANADMVGHSGNFAATVTAIEALDHCIGRVVAALKEVGGEALITADHGNAESMRDTQTGQPHTAHTSNPVPLVLLGRDLVATENPGVLSDLAPTLLMLMDLPIPPEMTGQPLFEVG